MQVQNDGRRVVSSGVTAKGKFGISRRSQAHIMTILRDNIYTDKIMAVLREYSANAWDAHRMVGKGDLPIHITLPDNDNPTLVIRDFGPGMSPRDVFNIYTQYGESTKRNTDDAVGMMGIGSKSAFAYSDSFNVTSWNGGMRRIYVAVLDASNEGDMQCLDERASGKTLKAFMGDAAFIGDLDDTAFYDLGTLDRMVESPEASALNAAKYLSWLDAQEILNANDMEAEVSEDEIQARRAIWDAADEDARRMIARTHAFITFAPTASCNDDVETGIEIQISVRIQDMQEFRDKAYALFRYFDPRPVINLPLPKIERKAKINGFVSSDMTEWIAVMGCIPYRLNMAQVSNDLEIEGLLKPLQRIKGGLQFNIGEVHISASREELKYTDFTKRAIVAKAAAMIDEHIEEALRDIQDPKLSDWDKRMKANFMAHVIGFKLPAGLSEWAKITVDMWGYLIPQSLLPKNRTLPKVLADKDVLADEDDEDVMADAPPVYSTTYADVIDTAEDPMVRMPAPRTFMIFHGRDDQAVHAVRVTQGTNTQFVIKDDPRSMKGFSFNHYDYVVRPAPNATLEDVQAELNEYITKAKMVGVPVKLLSEMGLAWFKPWEPLKRDKNPKHWTKAFKLTSNVSDCGSHHSQNWEAAQWEVSDQDVYVLLDSFVPKSYASASPFYTAVKQDQALAHWLKVPFPEIYGYKDTYTSPANKKKIKGTEYREWRVKYFTEVAAKNDEFQKLMEMSSWAMLQNNGLYVSDYNTHQLIKNMKVLEEHLGSDHVLLVAIDKMTKCNLQVLKFTNNIEVLEHVIKLLKIGSEYAKAMEFFEGKYPLLFKTTPLFKMQDHHKVSDWALYIKTCDDAEAYRAAGALADLIMEEESQGLPDLQAA